MRHIEEEMDKILDRYLEGLITKDEVRVMHRRLNGEEEAMDDDWDIIQLPPEILNPKEQNNARYNKENIRTRQEFVGKTPLSLGKKYALSTLLFLLIILLIPLFYLFVPQERTQFLFNKYFTIYEIENDLPNSNPALDQKWVNVVNNYQSEKYYTVVGLLKDLQQSDSQNTIAYSFYLGNCFLFMRNHEDAIKELEKVALVKSDLQDEALWYLALAYYLNKDLKKSKEILNEVMTFEGTPYKEQAILFFTELNALTNKRYSPNDFFINAH